MWIVQLALRQPHTFIVLALSIFIFGILSITQMAIDIFPVIDIPVVGCVWTCTGMSASDIENRITSVSERAFVSTVNDVEHIESTSLAGTAIVKIYLHKGADIGQAIAMVTSVGGAILKQLPPGMTPPTVVTCNAANVPVLQLGINSKSLSEAQLFDIANNFVRNVLATIQGTTIPYPYGGKFKVVAVDLNPDALQSRNLSATDVVAAINSQSIIAPSGTAKMGSREYIVTLNNSPLVIDQLNDIPIKQVDGATIYVRDVAFCHDGFNPQINIVNHNGRRACVFNILKNANASTLSVVTKIKLALPTIRSIVPAAASVDVLTDQSTFVTECVEEVVKEAVTAAGLTALMMLALLGSWRSTIIVATSIPLAILSAIIGLHMTGNTINSMTLGGLALAVGMLVDDATVEIENVHRNMAMGKHIETAILDGASQIALPTLVSTLSICTVFVPLVFLTEPSRSLFVPLGLSVIFAMLASYGLSRTIVPLMSKKLLRAEEGMENRPPGTGFFSRIHQSIEHTFETARHRHHAVLDWVLNNRPAALAMFFAFYAGTFCLLPFIGRDYFPTIDAGQLRLHIVAPPGTRVEVTEMIFKKIERIIAGTIIPKNEIEIVTDNIGMPVSGINYAFSDSQTISEADGEILITLTDKRSHSTEYYQRAIREMLTKQFPQCSYYYQPADIVTQILNAGLPAPIDIQIRGFDRVGNYKLAQEIKRRVSAVRGAVDVNVHQVVDAPQILLNVDRVRADQLGIVQNDISQATLVQLSSSFQVAPNFWLNPQNGVAYQLAVMTPQRLISSMDQLRTLSVTSKKTSAEKEQAQLLTNLVKTTRGFTPAVANHYDVQPMYDIQAAPQGRDLGGVVDDINKILDDVRPSLKRGNKIVMAGQAMSMNSAFIALIAGLVFALLLVYLLLVVNFQSWLDPLIILMAIPGAFSGILWALFVTQTTFSIPALMGTIMCMGVASANSILMVTFANEQMGEGQDPKTAALNAGFQRFRPVIMTAMAMIIGMFPMAVGSGTGGSQNAPIGRAVIGGLSVATITTLVFVPLMFYLMKSRFHKHTVQVKTEAEVVA